MFFADPFAMPPSGLVAVREVRLLAAPTASLGLGENHWSSSAHYWDRRMQLDASGDLIVDCRSAALTPTTGFIEVFAASHFLSAVAGNINVAPVRTAITGSMTTLAGPHMIAYEADSDELYVANAFGGDVLVFPSFASAAGNVAPTRVLGGSSTGLSIPPTASSPRTATGVFLDATR